MFARWYFSVCFVVLFARKLTWELETVMHASCGNYFWLTFSPNAFRIYCSRTCIHVVRNSRKFRLRFRCVYLSAANIHMFNLSKVNKRIKITSRKCKFGCASVSVRCKPQTRTKNHDSLQITSSIILSERECVEY